MAVKFIRKKGVLVLAVWLILQGVIPLLKVPGGLADYVPWVMAILAVVAGVLLILDM